MTDYCTVCGTECQDPQIQDTGEPMRDDRGRPVCSPKCQEQANQEDLDQYEAVTIHTIQVHDDLDVELPTDRAVVTLGPKEDLGLQDRVPVNQNGEPCRLGDHYQIVLMEYHNKIQVPLPTPMTRKHYGTWMEANDIPDRIERAMDLIDHHIQQGGDG